MSPSVDCSIIVPSYNTAALTLRCLEDLKARPPRASFEIILVDNHSSDGTAKKITERFPDVRLIENPANLGFAKACNRGAVLAKGRTLCFLNSDTQGAGEALDTLIGWMDAHPKAGIVGPELRSPDGGLIQMSWGWNPVLFGEMIQQYFAPYSLRRSPFKKRVVAWLQQSERSVSIVCGACLLIRREAFDRVKGFDEDFELYFEDSDLCFRCREAGWTIHFIPTAKIVHDLGQSTQGSWAITPLVYRQSQIHYYRMHAPAMSIPLLKGWQLLKWAIIWIKSFVLWSSRPRIRRYLSLFWNVIFEKRKLRLTDAANLEGTP